MDKRTHASNDHGAGKPQPRAAVTKSALRQGDARQLRFGQSFARIVAVLMRDPDYGKLRLADLEWLVLPPIMAGQFRLAQAPSPLGRATGKHAGREGGVLVPVAVALWARVSASIDKQLSEDLGKPVRLRPGDWASGDNIWLMAAAGETRAVPKLIDQLVKTELNGRSVKMRVRGPNNSVVVKVLGQHAQT